MARGTAEESGSTAVALAVAAGGGVGALARFALSGWMTSWIATPFPWGTFAVNLLGSLGLGYLGRTLHDRQASLAQCGFLTTGLCGGFTTFSTFDLEVLLLLREAKLGAAALYALVSVATCIAGVWIGARLAARAHGS